ncbi:MAG: hypothetical protein AAFQ15_07330, partial [Pseudomonadota bacterium]
MSWSTWIAPAGFFAISFAAGLFACALVKRMKVVDAPDGIRKTQAQPVPRLGGVAILFGTLIGTALSFLILMVGYGIDSVATLSDLIVGAFQTNTRLGIAIGFVSICFLIGLWDDIWTANTKLKLAILTLSALVSATLGLSASA